MPFFVYLLIFSLQLLWFFLLYFSLSLFSISICLFLLSFTHSQTQHKRILLLLRNLFSSTVNFPQFTRNTEKPIETQLCTLNWTARIFCRLLFLISFSTLLDKYRIIALDSPIHRRRTVSIDLIHHQKDSQLDWTKLIHTRSLTLRLCNFCCLALHSYLSMFLHLIICPVCLDYFLTRLANRFKQWQIFLSLCLSPRVSLFVFFSFQFDFSTEHTPFKWFLSL